MALDMAGEFESLQPVTGAAPAGAAYRPTVYDPPPYIHGPRHEYLARCFPHISPRVLARCLDRCLRRADPMLRHRDPPLMRLLEALPSHYAPNACTARGTEAFLRWRMPQLRRLLDSPTPATVRKALFTLADALHDPEQMTAAVRQGIPQKVLGLMYDKMPWVRERCLAILETIASSAVGRDCILNTPELLQNIKLLMFDEVEAVRFRAASALRMLALFRVGADDMDEGSLAPFLVYVLRWEQEPCILEIELFTLQFFLLLDSTQEACINEGAMEVLDTLKSKGSEVGAKAMMCLQRLASCPVRRDSANRRFLNSMGLHSYLASEDPQLNGPAAAFLTCLTLTTPGKITAYDNGMHALLLKIVRNNTECSRCQQAAFQALVNMSEYPACAYELKGVDFDLPLASDEARRARDRLVRVLARGK